MAYNKWVGYILSAVLIIALASASYLVMQRHSLEADNKHLDVVIDFQDLEKLVRYSPLDIEQAISEFKEAGVSGILFKELILADLEPHSVWVLSGSQLLTNDRYREALGANVEEINKTYNYLVTADENLHEQIAGNLQAKLLDVHLPVVTGGIQFVGVPINRTELGVMGLGFSEQNMQLAIDYDLNVVVQMRNWPQSSGESIKEVFGLLQPYRDSITTVLFNDSVLPGFPDYLPVVNGQIKELNATFGFIETFVFSQRGASNLGILQPNNVVRLHSIGANEMLNMSMQRALDRLTLAVTDRNVRVVLARLFFPMDTFDWLELNLQFIGGGNNFVGLVPALENEGFTIDRANAFPLHVTSGESRKMLTFFIGLGIISAGIILMIRSEMMLGGYILGSLGILAWCIVFLTGLFMAMAIKLMALASVIIFPVFAITLLLNEMPSRSITAAVVKLLIASAISLLGALLMMGLLAHLDFMLKLDQFAGVKAAHVLPILILVFIYYFWRRRSDWFLRINNLWNTVITSQYLVIIGVLAVVGFIYLNRTGNEAMAISSLELQFRALLDDLLMVRPRTKEFLIGHPFMLLLFYLGYSHRYMPLLLLGAIGQVSMVNTFAHVHTPVIVSFIRTVNGLWLGIVFGLALILLWQAYKYFERRLLNG